MRVQALRATQLRREKRLVETDHKSERRLRVANGVLAVSSIKEIMIKHLELC